MGSRRNQLTIAAVACLLGLLVVVQLRAQSSGSGLASLSAQELTVLVANLNDRNDQLSREVASLERELGTLTSNQSRGDTSIDEIRSDLAKVRAYAGLDPVTGPGATISVSGPIDGDGVEDLINELRTAGCEAIAAGEIRLVPGVVIVGDPGDASVDGVRLGDAFEIRAIGASEQLVGSLTRTGGVIAQLAATEPDVSITVTPMDRLSLPATDRDLQPSHGRPRL
jgi:uncharacterized protein YlxW (UPF0749 family)